MTKENILKYFIINNKKRAPLSSKNLILLTFSKALFLMFGEFLDL